MALKRRDWLLVMGFWASQALKSPPARSFGPTSYGDQLAVHVGCGFRCLRM